ncbi:ARF-like GTPase ARLP2, atypical [Purpureocillium lavendulum]|uniref:ARF-like GTPase ARLP2, atypical n=1 Tax=Purpureocillium lavendulum TaxID=1247861 RepID=A0AB34FXU9_9HYPO|nr:ARF-like GTPase ARLP2, atypical [Purpureocillium lavendulum]
MDAAAHHLEYAFTDCIRRYMEPKKRDDNTVMHFLNNRPTIVMIQLGAEPRHGFKIKGFMRKMKRLPLSFPESFKPAIQCQKEVVYGHLPGEYCTIPISHVIYEFFRSFKCPVADERVDMPCTDAYIATSLSTAPLLLIISFIFTGMTWRRLPEESKSREFIPDMHWV